jgi:hypothetical protein
MKTSRRTSLAMKRPFILASAPVDALEDCIRLCLAAGGEYTAGDAQDKLNSCVIGVEEEWNLWKTAWKGKTHQAIKMLERNFGGQTITMLAIAGGPACDWERGELRNNFCPQYPRTRRCSSSSSVTSTTSQLGYYG